MADVNFLAVCLFPAKKRVGSKKKVAKIRLFLCFFWKMTKFWLTLKLTKFVFFFFTETHKQVHNIFLNTFQIILGEISIPGYYFGIFTALVEKKLFFEKNWNFFLKRFTVVFDKNNFFIFLLFWKNLSLYGGKWILTPSF